MSQPGRILIVDDEPSVRMMLEAALRAQGYKVQTANSGADARDALDDTDFDLMLLDLRLGDMDGIDILQEAKHKWPALEVILLTAHGSIASAISALRYGAFDYLLKPAQVPEIRDRVERGIARRRSNLARNDLISKIGESVRALGVIESTALDQSATPINERIEVGPLLLDLRRHSATLGPLTLSLTRTEFSLLTALAQQPDTALSYGVLSESVYGRSQSEEEARALLRPHVARLRHKLEDTKVTGVTLVSIRSMGYMLQRDNPSQ